MKKSNVLVILVFSVVAVVGCSSTANKLDKTANSPTPSKAETSCSPPDELACAGVDMRYLNLLGVSLAGGDFVGADLRGQNLKDSDLTKANFSGLPI